ncbi:daptide biosynthesis RiPP recognition protein [Streptomyces flavidovirens]|uniref:daptide biosynthesis RiPP recognition protein n=1 Tax=Streptomyces flavidovirens TaxID=67298 RepID=UPI00368B9154
MSATKRHLMQWGTGRPATAGSREPRHGAATVVLEDPGHLAAVLASGLAGPESVVFVPGHPGTEADTGPDSGPAVIGYEGSFSEPGGEGSIGSDFYLQVQSYGVSAYMSVVGPTLLRVADDSDFEAFLDDADRARHDGVFADFLTHPVMQLADLPALGAGPVGDGPLLRLHIAADGSLSTSPAGRRLGTLGDSPAVLAENWRRLNEGVQQPCSVALGLVLPEDGRSAALAARPWLGRYLAAVEGLRDLRARGLDRLRVSGFGGRMVPALEAVPGADLGGDVPLLLWNEDASFLYGADASSGSGRRLFQLERKAAQAAEALLVLGSRPAAAEFADEEHLAAVDRFFTGVGLPLAGAAPVPAGR